jgi:SPP1 family predicted phage head-tail adaptor
LALTKGRQMPGGALRHIVTVQEPQRTAEHGDITTAWNDVADLRAQVLTVAGSETFRGRQLQADLTHLLTLRSTPVTRAITAQMRILWANRRLEIIRAADPDNARKLVELQCREIV